MLCAHLIRSFRPRMIVIQQSQVRLVDVGGQRIIRNAPV